MTITGSGGVGKTSAAMQVGPALRERGSDGVWLVQLAALADGSLIAPAIAAALGIALPANADGLSVLAKALAEKATILVFDNCEHLVRDAASVAQTLLTACPKLRILTTSRQPLGIPGETKYHMPSLGVPHLEPGAEISVNEAESFDAVALFVERARTADPNFTLTDENAPLVVDIVRRLDGIALAIELAVPKIKVFSVQQLRQRLDERFRILTGGSPTLLPRQQTLHATIGWSYDLLSEPEKTLLRRLGIFNGGFTLEAAEAVCPDEHLDASLVIELVSALVEKSLVVAEVRGDNARFRLLESTRAFALQKLTATTNELNTESADSEEKRLARRRAAWVASFADQVNASSWTTSEGFALAQVLPDLENIRAALHWTLDVEPDVEMAGRIAGGLTSLWQARSLGEGRRYVERILEQWTTETAPATEAAPAIQVLILTSLSSMTVAKKKTEYAAGAVHLCEDIGDRRSLAIALRLQADGLCHMQMLDEAEAAASRSAELFREIGLYGNTHYASLLQTHASICVDRGRITEARRLFAEAVKRFELIEDLRALAHVKLQLAELEFSSRNTDAAITLAQQAIEAFAELGDFVGQAGTSCNLAAYYLAAAQIDKTHTAAQIDEARTAARKALDFGLLVDIPLYSTLSLQHLGTVAALSGHAQRGALLLIHVDRWLGAEGFQREFTEQQAYDLGMKAIKCAFSEAALANLRAQAETVSRDDAIAEARLA